MTRRRWWAVTALLGCALIAGAWAVVLITRAGLDDADKLSSVLGGSASVVLSAAALWIAVRSRQDAAPPAEPPAGPVQINTASGQATVNAVQGGDLSIGDAAGPDDR